LSNKCQAVKEKAFTHKILQEKQNLPSALNPPGTLGDADRTKDRRERRETREESKSRIQKSMKSAEQIYGKYETMKKNREKEEMEKRQIRIVFHFSWHDKIS
jgi:hypothetical protein